MTATTAAAPGTSAPDARTRLVDVTCQALRDLDTEQLLRAVGVRRIAAGAGVSPSLVHHHFASLRGLAEAVEDHVYDAGPEPTAVTAPALARMRIDDFPLQLSLDTHVGELRRITTDPQFRPRMWLWCLGGERARAAYGQYLRTVDERLVAWLGPVYASWNREPRPPVDLATVIAVLVAGVNGAAVRQLALPDETIAHQFPRTQVALSTALLRRPGDPRDLRAHLTTLTHVPYAGGRDRREGRGRATTTPSRILTSARELFRAQGWQATTLAQITRRADTSSSTLHRYFPDKPALTLALLRSEAEDLLPLPVADLEASLLQHQLEEVAEFGRTRLSYLRPYVAALLTRALPADDPLVARTQELLPDPQDADAARRLVLLVLQGLAHQPDAPAPSLARHALARLLDP